MVTMRTTTKITSCKSCGYTEVRRTDRVYLGLDEGYLIKCPRCGAFSAPGYTVEEAIENWNIENNVSEEEKDMKQTVRPQEIVNALEVLRDNCLLHPLDCEGCPFYNEQCFLRGIPLRNGSSTSLRRGKQ